MLSSWYIMTEEDWLAMTGEQWPVIMNEEWSASEELERLLYLAEGKHWGTERKLRLFAVACWRRISHLMTKERERTTSVIELAERFADGLATQSEMKARQAVEIEWCVRHANGERRIRVVTR